MPAFSEKSMEKLRTCHPDLVNLFQTVVTEFDCRVLDGHRGLGEQMAAVSEGRSKTPWPESKHNAEPSLAVDVAPFPVDWKDVRRFYYFGGYVRAVAAELGIAIRWGGDWDGDTVVKDQTFNDLVHFELRR